MQLRETGQGRKSSRSNGGARQTSRLLGDASRFEQRVLAAEIGLRRSRGELDRITGSLEQSTIDLNPHQVRAAVFALDALERGGAILADEVGLGKTIEAGLVIRQLLSEGRDRILVLAPAPLRRQWQHELATRFHVDARIMDARSAGHASRTGEPVWDRSGISIASIPFAYNRREEIESVGWDLVVIDEAHRLRGVARGSSRQARGLRDALAGRPKLLLTATPFQNDLLELFGLVSFVAPELLGTEYSFQVRYMPRERDDDAPGDPVGDLRERLNSVVQRTLRRDVSSYLRFTERHGMLTRFESSDAEDRLRQDMAAYIASEDSVIFTGPRRALLALVYHKLLASSTFALASALDNLRSNLERAREDAEVLAAFLGPLDQLDGAYDEADESADEDPAPALAPRLDVRGIEREMQRVDDLARRARSIAANARGEALIAALDRAFAQARERREPTKAVIFTESRVTQQYLAALLASRGHAGRVVLFNGTNADPDSQALYRRWLEDDPERRALQREIGVREAIVASFREEADIMVATEAAAEGLNLQFCNIVVNYDMPWNPQRVEQRIGRCHRYGQQNDVLVLNFIDERNPVDVRVHELLERKFSLFDGVFGASDTPLGEVTTGVELERAIVDILRRCRTAVEIRGAFDRLEQRLDATVSSHTESARRELLDNFDPGVVEDLLGLEERARQAVASLDRRIGRVARAVLAPRRKDRISEGIFRCDRIPAELLEREPGLQPGLFAVGGRRRDPSVSCQSLTVSHPLVRTICDWRRELGPDVVEDFALQPPSTRSARLLGLEPGTRGFWEVLRVRGLEPADERLVHVVAICEADGSTSFLPPERIEELLSWDTRASARALVDDIPETEMRAEIDRRLESISLEVRQRRARELREESRRQERFAEESLCELDHRIAEVERERPRLEAEHLAALESGDPPTEEAARKLLDRLEDRLLGLRRQRLDAQSASLRAAEERRTRRRQQLAAEPAPGERVVAGRFEVGL